MQNPHFGSKIKIPKKHVKIHYANHFELFCAKNVSKNTQYSRNESILKIGHHACKGYSPCKILTSGQKLKFQNTFHFIFVKKARKNTRCSKNECILKIGHYANHLELFCTKNVLKKKHLIVKKWEHLKNWPSWKGVSPCKILTLGQKLKFQKTP